MTYPTPTGAPPVTAAMTSYTEPYFQQLFTRKWGSAAGNAYATYNTDNPQNTAYKNAANFTELVLVEGLDTAIQNAVTLGATADVGAVQGAATGAEKATATLTNPLASVGDFLARLTSPHTWLRVAEALVGVAFLIIGLNALLKNPAGKVAKVAAAVRP